MRLRPPPFPFGIVTLAQYCQLIVHLKRELIRLLCNVRKHSEHFAVIHNSQFLLNACPRKMICGCERVGTCARHFNFVKCTYCTNIRSIHQSLPRPPRTFLQVFHGRIASRQTDTRQIPLRTLPWPNYYSWRHSVTASIHPSLGHLHHIRIQLGTWSEGIAVINCSSLPHAEQVHAGDTHTYLTISKCPAQMALCSAVIPSSLAALGFGTCNVRHLQLKRWRR